MNIESSLYSISLAPKLASEIKKYTEHKNQLTGENKIDYVANTVAHAILGAVVAQLQGNSAIVGGLGAAYSERGAEIIAKILYPDKTIDKLSQEEKQQVSALAQLAAGLTTAALGGDAQDINTAMAGGKNAFENNEGSFENAAGMAPLIRWHDSYGVALDSALMAPNLTDEERLMAIGNAVSGNGAYDPLRLDLMNLPKDLAIMLSPYGTYIAFRDAESWGDYAIATASFMPELGGLFKFIKIGGRIYQVENKVAQNLLNEAETAYKAGDIDKGNQLMNKVASQSKQIEAQVAKESNTIKRTVAGKGTGATSETLKGLNKPVRPINVEFPPNQTVSDALKSDKFKEMAKLDGLDCSEIAEKLLDVAGGKGNIIEVRPLKKGMLNVFENGHIEGGQYYHQVYTDGKYIYDPRLSSNPIPKGDWEKHIKAINTEGITISKKLHGL